MNETPFDLAAMRHLRGIAEAGAAQDGQAVALNLQMEDGSTEWVALHHARLGRMVATLLFASGVAAQDRATARAAGGAAEKAGADSTLIEIVRVNAASAPGADHVVIRMVVGEGANLDFRIPLAVVPALQEKIAQALATASAPA